jgi:hypothetical protein
MREMAQATENGQEPTTNQPLQPTRDERMRSIRPILPATGNESESSALQTFQDKVLRPILKLQHELLLRLAGVGLLARHPDWAHHSEARKVELLTAWATRDLEVKKQIEGAIMALMTGEELDFYFLHEREFQRRIRTFVLERLRSSLAPPVS